MSDQFVSVEDKGLGSNLLDSIKGVATGAILFVLSFVVLWWNEGRADLSAEAKKAKVASPDQIESKLNGTLVSITGKLSITDKVADPEFLQPGDYLRLHRRAEMYAWAEKVETTKDKKVGGGSRQTRTVTYVKEWTDRPKSPKEMEHPKGHVNPPLTVDKASFSAEKAKVGAYPFAVADAGLPVAESLALTPDMLKPTGGSAEGADQAKPGTDGEAAGGDTAVKGNDKADEAAAESETPKKEEKKKKRKGRLVKKPRPSATEVHRAEQKAAVIAARKPDGYQLVDGKYLWRGSGTPANPEIGDVRVSFSATRAPDGSVTLFGLLDGDTVRTFKGKDFSLLRVLPGNHEQAIKSLADEHASVGWTLRVVGFLMMWIGLFLFFGPLNALLDIIPFLGSAGRVVVAIATLPLAGALSFVTIILSIVAHNPILLVLVLVGLGAGGYFLYQKKKKQKAGTPPPA